MSTLNDGDEAWMLISAALVQLMTPAVGLFYGGLVGEGSTVSTLMLSTGCMAVVTVLWSLIGYSMAFGPSTSTGIIGTDAFGTLNKITPTTEPYAGAPTISLHSFVMFQCMFAVITSAIISGAVVGKMRWTWFMLFTAIWHLCVYCPLSHWIFYNQGWLFAYGAIDFAGGMVIHVSSGVSALVLTTWLGGRWKPQMERPHNVPIVVLGAALLWFGWFGFNAGSAVSAGYGAGLAFTNTQLAPAMAMLTWAFLEIAFGAEGWGKGRPTAVGAATAAIVGLVGVTPAAGFVAPMWALFIGFYTALSVYFFPKLLKQFGFDDRLDTFAIHGIGGMVGSALTGLFADSQFSGSVDGSFYGNAVLLGKQCAAICVTIAFASIATTIIFGVLWVLAKVTGSSLTIPEEHQENADAVEHGEKAYLQNGATPFGSMTPSQSTPDLKATAESGANSKALEMRPTATSAPIAPASAVAPQAPAAPASAAGTQSPA